MRNGAGSLVRRVAWAVLLLVGLSACNRNAVPMTECVGAAPAVERVRDVGPPNCSTVLPGAAVPQA